jgi:hypothetical protein
MGRAGIDGRYEVSQQQHEVRELVPVWRRSTPTELISSDLGHGNGNVLTLNNQWTVDARRSAYGAHDAASVVSESNACRNLE